MSSDEKVLDFPRVEGTSEENARRVMVEATRLASLAPGEWRLWIDRSAERLRIPRAILEDVIAAIIKDSETKARDAETAARRQELAVRREQERKQREQKREQERTDKRAEHKRKEREKAFEGLISLPSEQQETRLGELAKRLDEDVAIIRVIPPVRVPGCWCHTHMPARGDDNKCQLMMLWTALPPARECHGCGCC